MAYYLCELADDVKYIKKKHLVSCVYERIAKRMYLECPDGLKEDIYKTVTAKLRMLTDLLLFSNMSTNTRRKQEVKRTCLNVITCRGIHQVKQKERKKTFHRSFSVLLI